MTTKTSAALIGRLWHLALCMTLVAAPGVHAEEVTWSAQHTFSMYDVQGDYEGLTYGDDPTVLCGTRESGSPDCPADTPQPYADKLGIELFPIDSVFGFHVEDFVGAASKERGDDYWGEGFAGNIYEAGELVGVRVSNASTDFFKTKSRMGTWCVGLGGNKVKCSTEHYSALEHVSTCYETVPYMYADPLSGDQGPLYDPETGALVGSCDEGKLDNVMKIVRDGVVTDEILVDPTPGVQMEANESTVRNDIAISGDYSITLKDDGKALYRWGNLIKRPNDIRLYARLALPPEWKANPTTAYPVTSARLVVEHLITNNPNDQLRPEDMENENAHGRLPEYIDLGSIWLSSHTCYEGDGDYIAEGTFFKNEPYGPLPGSTDPYLFSSDLVNSLTNAWYTTTQRDPFEADPNDGIGPRWRLKANKFGQDIPGLEIPITECSEVPFTHDNLKYPVGEPTITTINLLDWEDGVASPLATSLGWIDAAQNIQNEIEETVEGGYISVNGLPLTEDFDLAVYIKGDKKETSIFNATLEIVYEGEGGNEPPADDYDVAVSDLKVPSQISYGKLGNLRVEITNIGPEIAGGTVILTGEMSDVVFYNQAVDFGLMAPGQVERFDFDWMVSQPSGTVNWMATVVTDGDTNPVNDTFTATTIIR